MFKACYNHSLIMGGGHNYYQPLLRMRKLSTKRSSKYSVQSTQPVSGKAKLGSQVLWLLTSDKNLSKYRHAEEKNKNK